MQLSQVSHPDQYLLAAWRTNRNTRATLIERLTNIIKNIGTNKEFTYDHIIYEYYRAWLYVPLNEPLQRLLRHPLLKISDNARLYALFEEYKQNQVKLGIGLSVGTLMIYTLFFSRMARFQQFFNNREKSKWGNRMKKCLGTYTVFLAWIAALNSHYSKKIPRRVNYIGLFKYYEINFDLDSR